jgi:hypothetical protein
MHFCIPGECGIGRASLFLIGPSIHLLFSSSCDQKETKEFIVIVALRNIIKTGRISFFPFLSSLCLCAILYLEIPLCNWSIFLLFFYFFSLFFGQWSIIIISCLYCFPHLFFLSFFFLPLPSFSFHFIYFCYFFFLSYIHTFF